MMFIIGTGKVLACHHQRAIERKSLMIRRRARAGHRNCQSCVRTQIRFVRSAVKVDQNFVDRRLIERVSSFQLAGNQIVDVADGFQHAFAAITFWIAVAQFNGFMLAGGGAGRNRRASSFTTREKHVGLNSWIAARIQNFAGVNLIDFTHKLIDELGRDFIIRHGQMKN
jgi:hypothetical protein